MTRDLRVAAMKARAAASGTRPACVPEEEEENDEIGALSFAPHTVPPARSPRAFTPLKADSCFTAALEVEIPARIVSGDSEHGENNERAILRVYFTPPRDTGPDGSLAGTTVFLCHHGAGFGGLSYALTAKEIKRLTNGEAGVLAYDCRGHGRTQFSKRVVRDMSLEALTGDLILLIKTMFPESAQRPKFVLVGHSMGGAVVVAAAHALQEQKIAHITGTVMIDIVEGTSLSLLPVMGDIIRRRPAGFVSVEAAIQWHVESGTIRNMDSARHSVPSLVTKTSDESSGIPWRWCANLPATEPFWRGWFTSLSSRFLTTKSARMLILAQSENLDSELMIGNMQGKYQLVMSPDAGHCVQEDLPQSTARSLVQFWQRNDRLPMPIAGVKKVGET